MPLADKIIELRKKQGWSQIDLADRLDVSRQSVSKWEMAQAVPELDKILKMSELFAVTTDYLLKDEAPAPDSGGALPPPPPAEEPPTPAPAPKKQPKFWRKKWPWVQAACLVVVAVLALYASRHREEELVPPRMVLSVELPQPSPIPEDMVSETATEETYQEAVSAPEMENGPVMEMSTYEAGGYTVDGIIEEELLAAVAAEYAPYGITCEDGRWYYDGQPIRVFTDVLTSNGESLTGGRFQGTIRNFAGEGDIDVRTVRDYDHCDRDGNGKLLYIETCPARGDAVWTEHHAEEEHHE